MCNYSQLIKEESMNVGRIEGRATGQKEGLFMSICSLMENMKISMPEAMKLLNIPESDYSTYQKMMK